MGLRLSWERIFTDLTGLSILQELEIHSMTISDTSPYLCNHVKKDTNRVAATDGVAKLFEVVGEPRGIQALYQVHACMIQSLRKSRRFNHKVTYINTAVLCIV